jgi:hypothetical protein
MLLRRDTETKERDVGRTEAGHFVPAFLPHTRTHRVLIGVCNGRILLITAATARELREAKHFSPFVQKLSILGTWHNSMTFCEFVIIIGT